MNQQTYVMLSRLERAGISINDALALRRIAMTLHRWHELECGIGDSATFYIERETEEDDSPPHMKRSDHTGLHDLGRIPDREKGALKRLKTIVARYPELLAYVQSDPRGAPLYIVASADIPAGEDISSYYSRGIAVYQ